MAKYPTSPPPLRNLQSGGQALRVFYAFDPRRAEVVLVGAHKRGPEKRFYRKHVRSADAIYEYLRQQRRRQSFNRDQGHERQLSEQQGHEPT